jgi:phospholipase/lecithinase/hemolysin
VALIQRENQAFGNRSNCSPSSFFFTSRRPLYQTSHSMRKLALLALGIALCSLGVLGANALDLRNFERMVVFGDSLSDTGNSFILTGKADPPEPFYGDTFDGTDRVFPGRFTDGENWVDYFPLVAHHFPRLIAFLRNEHSPNATNFAVGGALSTDLLTPQTGQIPTYLSAHHNQASPNDLYVIWIGANDFAARVSPEISVENIREGIAQLAKAGARSFVVINVPDLSLTPEVKALGPATVQAAKQFVFSLDVLLEVELPLSAFSQRVTIDLVDINRIFVPIVFNPAKFGFTNSVGVALNPATDQLLVSDPNDYVFWDGFHPTTKVHLLAAQFIYQTLASEHGFREFGVASKRALK